MDIIKKIKIKERRRQKATRNMMLTVLRKIKKAYRPKRSFAELMEKEKDKKET